MDSHSARDRRGVLLVADRLGIGAWCASLIATTPALSLVAWFSSIDDAAYCAGGLNAQVCLLAASQARRPAADQIRATCPRMSIVLIADSRLTFDPADEEVGILPCSATRADLLEAIGAMRHVEGAPGRFCWSDTVPDLSMREREVAALLTEGYANAQIAHMLSISESTVKNHVHHVLGKLRVSSRSAVASALVSDQQDSSAWRRLSEPSRR